MYRRKNKGWLKHLDFIILDLLCLQVCFALAYFSRHGLGGNPHKVIYQNMMLVLVLFEFIYAFFLEGYKAVSYTHLRDIVIICMILFHIMQVKNFWNYIVAILIRNLRIGRRLLQVKIFRRCLVIHAMVP